MIKSSNGHHPSQNILVGIVGLWPGIWIPLEQSKQSLMTFVHLPHTGKWLPIWVFKWANTGYKYDVPMKFTMWALSEISQQLLNGMP